MSLSDLAAIGAIVSGVAVALSLVFLGIQIRQANRNQVASIQHGRAARIVDLNLRIAEPSLALVMQRGTAGDTTLAPSEFASFRRAFIAMILNFEDGFFQRRDGMLAARSEASDIGILRSVFRQTGSRALWETMHYAYEPEFVRYVDGIIRTTPLSPIPDPAAAWKATVGKMSEADGREAEAHSSA